MYLYLMKNIKEKYKNVGPIVYMCINKKKHSKQISDTSINERKQ